MKKMSVFIAEPPRTSVHAVTIETKSN